MKHANEPKWPDLSKDQRAWELAKVALGPDAPVKELVERAEQIKGVL